MGVLSNDILKEFAKVTNDRTDSIENTTCYGTAVFNDSGEYVLVDGADDPTPATFSVSAHNGDRVLVMLKNHQAIVIGNITTPTLTIGILKADVGVIVKGYLTTNEDRTQYDDQNLTGLTFSEGGIGANGGNGKFWYVTNTGHLYASDAEIVGKITANSGYLGTMANGFHIDEYGIYSGVKSLSADGFITLSNQDFTRPIGKNTPADLRFAIGSGFGVAKDGTVYSVGAKISGELVAESGYLGSAENGFTIDAYGIFSGAKSGNRNGFITLSNSDFERTLNDQIRTNLRFAIGSNFGVSSSGILYASAADISGKITASSGRIGDFEIGSGIFSGGKNSINHANGGVYIGSDGIGLGPASPFVVTSAGKLTATGADISGKITAESGFLGSATSGFHIDEYGIFSGTKASILAGSIALTTFDFTRSINGTDHQDLRFAIGGNFGVSNSGILYASGAEISGVLTAGAGSTIGPWTVGANSIWKAINASGTGAYSDANSIYFGNQGLSITDNFQVSSSGTIIAKGTITAEAGSRIGPWYVDANSIYTTDVRLNKSFILIGNTSTSMITLMRTDTGLGQIHMQNSVSNIAFQITDDSSGNYYTVYSNKSLNLESVNNIYLDAQGGYIYLYTSTSSPTNYTAKVVSYESIEVSRTYPALIVSSTYKLGLYSYSNSGRGIFDFVKGSYGTDSWMVYLDSNNWLCTPHPIFIEGANSLNVSSVDHGLYRRTKSSTWGWIIRTTSVDGTEATCVGNNSHPTRLYGSGVYLHGTSTAVTSDRRVKKNIKEIGDRYDSFFLNLKPSVYQMIDGNSGRLHSGFIAQEVEEALDKGGLTTSEFGGIVIGEGEEQNRYLRYEEFIALNTYMIQKLYKRIDELERKLKGA